MISLWRYHSDVPPFPSVDYNPSVQFEIHSLKAFIHKTTRSEQETSRGIRRNENKGKEGDKTTRRERANKGSLVSANPSQQDIHHEPIQSQNGIEHPSPHFIHTPTFPPSFIHVGIGNGIDVSQLNRHKKDSGDKNGTSSSGTASPDKDTKKGDKHPKSEKPLPVPQTISPRAQTPPRNTSPSPAPPPSVVVTSSPVNPPLFVSA